MSQIDEIRSRWEKATPGPWRWFGRYLATTHSGRRAVIVFGRWGMRDADPLFCTDGILEHGEKPCRADIDGIHHPDAEAIASAPEDVRVLLAEVDRLRAENDTLRVREAKR